MPTTRNFSATGGGGAIVTSGNGAWTAGVSDSWITLNATSGNVGYPVAYTVSANTNVEQRTGYVYVSGWTHTITQDGVGGTISPESASFELAGGIGNVTVSAPNKMVWQVRPNVDWLSITQTSGSGTGTVRYYVEPYEEVATRQGTLTVAGNTFTVFQYGRRIKLDSYSTTQDYESHVISITVNALAVTQWNVTPKASWISVVDAGNGQGGDMVTIAIAENPSYKSRTGTVKIGTETFTVTQQGRPTAALEFDVNPANSTASVNGANGLIAVTATPDLPWTATSEANWITVYVATASGAGNGNVVYVTSPNPRLSRRTGKVSITPATASGMTAKTHSVTQPAANAAISLSGYEFEAAGESCSVEVSCADIVEWSITESLDWVAVNGSTSRVGPGTVTLEASANNTVYPRTGKVTIAGKTFTVTQKARGVELEYDTKLFGTDGGFESISIHPDGNVSWTAVASDATWITVFQGDSGTGDGEILYIISPYVGDGSVRTGWITVGDKKVYITQRAYDLTIEPNGSWVTGNNGAGEFGVSAGIDDVWNAIVTEPWITLVSGYDAGTGNGTVRFLYTENSTGKTRTGKIIVAGEVYTLEQRARQMVTITVSADHGGTVSGGGTYDLGTDVTLTAVPDSGYKFSYWTGALSSMQNPLVVTVDTAKSYTAVFEPLPIAFTAVESSVAGVSLEWDNLAWATTYRIYRGITSVPSSATLVVELPNNGNCTYLDETGDVEIEYWYWIEAEGPSDSVMSDPMTGRKTNPITISPITYTNLRGATNPNPTTYQEGMIVSFASPGAAVGYTFSGWTPAQITADMTGAQVVRAEWTANGYAIVYNANGGSGTMDATLATYDSEAIVQENGFTWTGHVFMGWATNETDEVIYASGQAVTNLTAQSGGVVMLYAVWAFDGVQSPVVNPADGSIFKTDTCIVTISCATPDAVIYYSANGRTPTANARYLYSGPFTISETTTVTAFAVKDGRQSEYVDATITRIISEPLTLRDVLDEAKLGAIQTGGDAEWTPTEDDAAKVGSSCAISGTVVDDDDLEHTTWLKMTVSGRGTFSFWWRVDCEPDPRGCFTYDYGYVMVDGAVVDRKDGTTEWMSYSMEFDTEDEHEIIWTYVADGYPAEGGDYTGRMWVDGVSWSGMAVANDPIPEIGADADVAEALAGSADARLGEYIKTALEYNAYRDWVEARGLDHQMVKDSPRAWFSYALDAEDLIECEFVNGDVVIDSLVTERGGVISIEVNVEGVKIGANAKAENLARVFSVEGASALNATLFSSKNVTATLGVTADGKLSVVATPKSVSSTLFVRVCMQVDEDNRADSASVEDPEDVSFTVTFDANGGEGGTMRTILDGETLGMLPIVTRQGYDFRNWWTHASGGTQISSSTVVTNDTIYYAHWDILKHMVIFNANGGVLEVVDPTRLVAHGSTVGTLPTPLRDGYVFDGWWTEPTGGTQVAASTPVVDEVTYYAHWIQEVEPSSGAKYCVIDLSEGANAQNYPVSYLKEAPSEGFNTDDYKTTQLVLCRIEPGSFKMGGKYNVTLTEAFYCGIFEVTQKQYELVTGRNPSPNKGAMRPVEKVSWNVIRGNSSIYNWPSSTDVDPSTFMGRIRSRTGLDFDLPTEAQWEYACRAGTTSYYNNGGNTVMDLNQLGRYVDDKSDGKGGCAEHTVVGAYLPNAWGLYDMHGNVSEWCLDWYGDLSSNMTDPKGPLTGTDVFYSSNQWRVNRGGDYNLDYDLCKSSHRGGGRSPGSDFQGQGFRLAMTLSDETTVRVTFDANGGSMDVVTTERSVIQGSAVGTLPMPMREGYTFNGWYTALTGGMLITSSTKVNGDVTFHANWTKDGEGTYCVIDLSAGANATSYPVSYLNLPPRGGFNTDEYKTTKFVLRRIEPGIFSMGGVCNVTLTKVFYCGIFEVTQKQYELVTGVNPSQYKNDTCPVHNVSWDAIRGNAYSWPNSTNVDTSTFIGKIQACTGLRFDLPTEAQWEYACRAGTTSEYNNGGSIGYDLLQLGRYYDNKGDGKGGNGEYIAIVGSYLPNIWGLYDMHGNVSELCLDNWYEWDSRWNAITLNGIIDPVGPSTSNGHVFRGGSWDADATACTSSARIDGSSLGSIGSHAAPARTRGIRLVLNETQMLIHTVIFNANGGTGSFSRSVAHDGLLGLYETLPNPYKREGFTFDGWYTEATGGTQVTELTAVTGDMTCYAHWDRNKVTITFNANGGSLGGEEPNMLVPFCTMVGMMGALPTPTRDGYIFDGWYTEETEGVQIDGFVTVIRDCTWYAHWTQIVEP